MASTISYAKIVRNQKDEQIEPSDEKSPEGRKTKCQESLIKSQSPEIDDQSFKEVSSVKKVYKSMFIFLIEEIYSLKLAFYSKCFSQILICFYR